MSRFVSTVAVLSVFCAIGGCASSSNSLDLVSQHAPLFDGMGGHHRRITTSDPKAQRYFDQGLVWAFAFNHDEAIRSFTEATRLDPDCAMAWWGIALCHGPHINYPLLPDDRAAAAWHALQQALAIKHKASPTEQALIDALAHRYADPPPSERAPLDQAYADAMADVWADHPNDADIGTLYAEALMDLHPWNLWTQSGEAQRWTGEILRLLESVRDINPNHPGALHLYIHAVEASSRPSRADDAANRLRDLVPASGHLVHMPSHIDVLTGRWAMASQQNEKAIAADRKYRKAAAKQGFYSLYMAHNHHMLAFASMMEGRSEAAIRAARGVVHTVPEEYKKDAAPLVDPYMGALYDALKRFGRWDDILREPAPPSFLPITTAMWRYARGLAYAAKGEVENAEGERAKFAEIVNGIPDDALMAINRAHDILHIAEHVLDAEIALRRGQTEETVSRLRQAIEIEDSLLYMEPPEWMQPVRHTLGAVLLDAGRFVEAEKVYREDLVNWPANGWSLYGLSRALRGQGKTAEANHAEAQFKKAWSRADTGIESSCLCIPKT